MLTASTSKQFLQSHYISVLYNSISYSSSYHISSVTRQIFSPFAFSRRAVVSYWRKYVHEVLVNRLGGLSLLRKSVVRLTDRPDMTLDVYRGRKTTMQQQQQIFSLPKQSQKSRSNRWI